MSEGSKEAWSSTAEFSEGLAVFVLNDKGILVDANMTGSKYWLDSDLNQ